MKGARRHERRRGLRGCRGPRGRRRPRRHRRAPGAVAATRQSLRSGARGCCSVEDAHDARRVADVLGIPFYVWDLAERFADDVVDDFVAEYAAGRTPNPCLRCNEKIKFAARARPGARAGLRRRVHRPLRPAAPTAQLHRAVDPAKDQSYVLGVLDPEQLAARDVPARRLTKDARARRGGRARLRGRRQARQPRHLLHRRTATPAAAWRGGSAQQPGAVVDAVTGDVVGEHDGAYAFTVGQRTGLRLERPARTASPATSSTSSR